MLGQDEKCLGAILVPLPECLKTVVPEDEWGAVDGELTNERVRGLMRQELDRIPRLVARYKQAILDSVFAENDGQQHVQLGELASSAAPIRYGVLQPGDIKDIGIPLIRVCDLIGGKVDWESLRKISEEIDALCTPCRSRP